MKSAWQAQPERGSSGLMTFIAWLSLTVGKPIGRLLLYPICAYFFTFSRAARAASHKYLSTIFGRPMPLREVYRHYHTFSRVVLDRIERQTGRRVMGVRVAKFRSPLRPGTDCLLRLSLRTDGALDLVCSTDGTAILSAILDCDEASGAS